MSKKILAVYFTQSGQLGDIIDHFTKPLESFPDTVVEKVRIYPAKPFPFPWTSPLFFNAMPESVDGVPTALEPFTFKEAQYDLIILGYQPWFLSPSIPAGSLLRHLSFKAVLNNTPVVTISGCRNMWINAQEKVKNLLKEAGANLVGNIALVDRHNNYTSLVTILYWMLTGKKDRKWGLFPKPGVSDEDIVNSAIFGETVKMHLQKNEWSGLQTRLQEQHAVNVRYSLMFIERKAGRIFTIWSKIINKSKKRSALLVAFKYYLLIALCIAAPIILLVDAIFFKPFLGKRIKKQKEYYAGVTLK
ncbi:hypothetical protein [Agriterribacter humi]|jgi:hypothetical protein|uniref:hypothetical protein n=1 Tax=Agriterribacter humi TaxID=1104781 RepID=UPI0012658C0A|nr:hypothetical protein [Agriterribacter humi]